jgi:hypothetical protein
MSWSTIEFSDRFAHAHDWEQVLFMSLASECLDSLDEFRDSRWLHDWKDYWITHKATHGNGCSDIGLHTHLTSEPKIAEFRRFLSRYTEWIRDFGTEIPINRVNEFLGLGAGARIEKPCQTDELQQFVTKILALLDGSPHPSIHQRTPPRAEHVVGGNGG